VGRAVGPRVAFVVEQTLGHVTHSQNLERAVRARPFDAAWLPIEFGPGRLGRVPLLSQNWSARASWRARRALRRADAERGLDAILFHTQVTSLFCVPLMKRTPSMVCLDATPRNFDEVGRSYGHRPLEESALSRLAHGLNLRAIASARALVAWSEWTRRSLIAEYHADPSKIAVLAPGAALPFFEIGARREQRVRRAGPMRVLFVGGDLARKGGDLLLRATREMADVEVHLVTGARVAPREGVIVHNGITPNSPQLLALFEDADAFALPTLGDCLPLALMEASAAGLPIVTADVGACAEAVVPGQSGMVLRPGDVQSLREAIAGLAADKSRRAAYGRASHAHARRRFDADANNRRLLDMIEELATRSRHRRAA